MNTSDPTEIVLEDFSSITLPSLEELAKELEADDDSAYRTDNASDQNEAAVGGIRVVGETPDWAEEQFIEIKPPQSDSNLLKRENEELITALRRVQSDFENYRRRVERDRSENYAYALTSIVKDLLQVLDNFRLALANSEASADERDVNQFFQGFELILLQLETVLSRLGIKPVPAMGEAFNPHFHEAVATEAREDIEPNTIIEEILRGYSLGERLIRPAMVKVSTRS